MRDRGMGPCSVAHPSLLESLPLRPLHFFDPFIPPLSTTTLILDSTLVLADFTPFHARIVRPSSPSFLRCLHELYTGLHQVSSVVCIHLR
jgi:hypothetical protein